MDGSEPERAAPISLAGRFSLVRAVPIAAAVLLLGLCTATFFLLASGVDYCSLASVGLPGITLIMFLSSSTVLLPAPGIAAVGLAGAAWDPVQVGLFAALGSALGEMTGYVVGYGGRQALGRQGGKWWVRGERLMRRWGFLVLLTMAAVPNPFFDAVGILAGSLRYPPAKLFVAILIGNALKYGAAAALGDFATGGVSC